RYVQAGASKPVSSLSTTTSTFMLAGSSTNDDLHQRLPGLRDNERFPLRGAIDELRELSLGFVDVDGDQLSPHDRTKVDELSLLASRCLRHRVFSTGDQKIRRLGFTKRILLTFC